MSLNSALMRAQLPRERPGKIMSHLKLCQLERFCPGVPAAIWPADSSLAVGSIGPAPSLAISTVVQLSPSAPEVRQAPAPSVGGRVHVIPEKVAFPLLPVGGDNSTVVAYINHQRGLQCQHLHKMARELLTWAQVRLLSLRAANIPGVLNTVADMLSRDGPPEGEWRLHPQVVLQIWERFGKAQEGMFASRENTHLPCWFSMSDPAGPLGLDALADV
ncbi:hypothetical protein SKAU_G00096870 [Synaphobranchus kaupii]|uniref:Uncharacterized protein n=1 Tax=Synaphobranchus kaupii TaxID=118154 RepID=A0A9Q1FYD0_SYNKA|nr:hypothetical protein SKAU_G00096870 [Synaphobranchus kaupii]